MWFDVVYNKPEYFKISGDKVIELSKPENYQDPLRNPPIEDQIGFMAVNVEKGLNYVETFGVGGMNTRGMGRLKVLNIGG
jgi:CRISPR-associated protein Cmr4